jgi:hypothetical protein
VNTSEAIELVVANCVVPFRLKVPPFALLNVGAACHVAFLEFPLKSAHVVPDPE